MYVTLQLFVSKITGMRLQHSSRNFEKWLWGYAVTFWDKLEQNQNRWAERRHEGRLAPPSEYRSTGEDCNYFCRAMLWISAVVWCLSVWCPSRLCIVSKRVNIFSNFLSPSAGHTILAFHIKPYRSILTGTINRRAP